MICIEERSGKDLILIKFYYFKQICELAYAKFQGRKELINHFEKGCVLNFESEDKRPLILSPPTKFPLIKLPSVYLKLIQKYFDLFKCIYPFSRYTKDRKTFEISDFYHFDQLGCN